MFDLSTDILIPSLDMLDNNNGDYYYGYNEFENQYDLTFDEFDSTSPVAQAFMGNQQLQSTNQTPQNIEPSPISETYGNQLSNSGPANLNLNQQLQQPFQGVPHPHPNQVQVHSQSSVPSTSLLASAGSLNSSSLNLSNFYNEYNNFNHLSVNVNLSNINTTSSETYSTPGLTSQIQSPNTFMYSVPYDNMATGSTYNDYKYSPQFDYTTPQQNVYNTQQNTQSQKGLSIQRSSSSSSSIATSTTTKDKKGSNLHENKIITSNHDKYRVVRGVAAGGSTTRPPKDSVNSNSTFLPIDLELVGATIEEVCGQFWSPLEREDQRRIVRIERIQEGPKIIANFSILGSANENPTILPPPINSNIDVIEVSCLQCPKNSIDSDEKSKSSNYLYDYYITSVEVIEIVELLVGTMSMSATDRRKERGRVRSNLVPFWSKKPISSRLENTTHDYRIELAKRIMSYEIRKPRGFDKEVRILKWERLIPALKRALQCYYCELPDDDY